MMRKTSLLLTSSLSLWLVACAPSQKGAETDALVSLDDGKSDSLQAPTEHGELTFGTSDGSTLATSARFHSWTFTLSGPAQLHLATLRAAHSATVDTVLYLYKRGPSSWGSYVARNDDASAATVLSAIDKKLEVGTYRVVVKGYGASDLGKFLVVANCSGIGCQPPAPAPSCLFGDSFNEIGTVNGVQVSSRQKFTSPTGLLPVHELQIVKALHASTHTDVTTVAEAFAAADEGELNKVEIYDAAGARAFTAWEYGAGDNSYGAIFVAGSDT
jgi:hypothetical protein